MLESLPQYLIMLIMVLSLTFFAALLWMLYLIKLATNEDSLLRKIIAEQRRREELRRIQENKRKKRKADNFKQDKVMKKMAGGSTPTESKEGDKESSVETPAGKSNIAEILADAAPKEL